MNVNNNNINGRPVVTLHVTIDYDTFLKLTSAAKLFGTTADQWAANILSKVTHESTV